MVRNVIPAPPTPRRAETAFWTTGTIAIVIGGLYIGRDILVPLALSILLSFVLTPPMLWLRRHGIPRIPSTAIVVLVAFTAIAGVALAVGSQLIQLAQNLPTYQRNVQQKIAGLRASAPGAGLVERVTNSLKDLRTEMTRAEPTSTASSRPAEIEPRREPAKSPEQE